jgi:DNA-directed RNA polymerase specialized sigma24 family protein
VSDKDRAPIFPTTDWSLVEPAGPAAQGNPPRLERLLSIYLPALRTYLRITRRCSTDVAEELVHEFAASKLVGTSVLSNVRRERGRFRTYLLSVFQHHLTDQHRRFVSRRRCDEALANDANRATPPDRSIDPFDLAWARSVLNEATERMRRHLLEGKREVLWRIFESRVLIPTLRETDPPPYEQMVGEYGFATATQACSAVVTARRMFARFLREVIGEYAGGDDDDASIDDELNDLRRILAGRR